MAMFLDKTVSASTPWLRSNPTDEWSQDALLLAWHRTNGSTSPFLLQASLLPFLTPGHPPNVFTSLCMQMHSHLPAAVPEQALHRWWCPDLPAESTSGDGPGACWPFFGALKPSSQHLKFLVIQKIVDFGAILLAVMSLPVKPFFCKTMMTACACCQVTMVNRGRTQKEAPLSVMDPLPQSANTVHAFLLCSLTARVCGFTMLAILREKTSGFSADYNPKCFLHVMKVEAYWCAGAGSFS